MVREAEVRAFIKGQILRSYLLYAVLQTGILLLLAPLFLALGLPVWGFGLYCLLMLVLKWFLFQAKAKKFFTENGLDWQVLVAYEAARKQTILRFFALFTNVKGISNSVKRRAYLDGLTRLVGKQHSKTWQNLFLRSYLRNGDFFALTLRLLFLALLALIFVSQAWIAAAFAVLFNYLLLFQLTALYEAFDYQFLTQLFPIERGEKLKGARQIITSIGISVLLAEVLTALLFFQDKTAVLAMLGATALLYLFYLPFKLRRLVD